MNKSPITKEEALKSRIKRRIRLATWYDIGCMILIVMALFMLGDIAVSRINGTFSLEHPDFVSHGERIAEEMERNKNATPRHTAATLMCQTGEVEVLALKKNIRT